MTIATLSSASAAPLAGAGLRRLFGAWSRTGVRKWPFPPRSPAARDRDGALAGRPAGAGSATLPTGGLPVPVPGQAWGRPAGAPGSGSQARPAGAHAGVGAASAAPAMGSAGQASLGDVRQLSTVQALGVRRMVIDVLLVAMWGAMIPALMWLGAAAGF